MTGIHINHHQDGTISIDSLSYESSSSAQDEDVERGDDHKDNDSSSFGLSSTAGETEATPTKGTNDHNSASQQQQQQQALGQRETRWLSKARMLMLFCLVVAAANAAVGTHIFMKRIEEDDFTTRVSGGFVGSRHR